uniref:PPPDE domain-containing protein n=1 Tax=Noctiluca scintillans TaxID=2966 RepID=A0A7S1AAG9_NOCSC|mmetsp:Transcript_38360/g.102116  ORF Transcript_38360/g.102116 Transcript_38360/m.102116 type:complete len:503 (+) Transcript_38360:55-1563(+)
MKWQRRSRRSTVPSTGQALQDQEAIGEAFCDSKRGIWKLGDLAENCRQRRSPSHKTVQRRRLFATGRLGDSAVVARSSADACENFELSCSTAARRSSCVPFSESIPDPLPAEHAHDRDNAELEDALSDTSETILTSSVESWPWESAVQVACMCGTLDTVTSIGNEGKEVVARNADADVWNAKTTVSFKTFDLSDAESEPGSSTSSTRASDSFADGGDGIKDTSHTLLDDVFDLLDRAEHENSLWESAPEEALLTFYDCAEVFYDARTDSSDAESESGSSQASTCSPRSCPDCWETTSDSEFPWPAALVDDRDKEEVNNALPAATSNESSEPDSDAASDEDSFLDHWEILSPCETQESTTCCAYARTGSEVFLHVYDLHAVTRRTGLRLFHTGIEVYGSEMFYGSQGIQWCQSGKLDHHLHRKSVSIGWTTLSATEILALCDELKPKWQGSQYHLFNKNCQTFTDELSFCLGVQQNLPRRFVRFSRWRRADRGRGREPLEPEA